jgi:hypothetical protein
VRASTFGLIQGTFGTVQGTFGTVQGTFGTVQGTLRPIQGTFTDLVGLPELLELCVRIGIVGVLVGVLHVTNRMADTENILCA